MGLAMEHGSPYSRAGGSQRDCWYYLRYFFLFVSLIQFLIILGLVLFMVYGNVHVSTESNLQATERRAEGLYNQVVGLAASQANLSKELNHTARSKEAITQMLHNARRDLDRINASFRQCQIVYANNERYLVAIILSEKQCQEQFKETNKSCNALTLMLTEKTKTLEVELVKEKAVCTKDRESLALSKRVLEEQLAECNKAREQQRRERQLAEDRLQKVQSLCLSLDKNKFETDMRNLWRDYIMPRVLDKTGYSPYHPLSTNIDAIRINCDNLPLIMSNKVEDLARSLRTGIEGVARENADIQRQKLEAEQRLRDSQEAKEKAEKEAQAREVKLQAECARQTQLALEDKAALRKERDNLAKELEEKKREAEYLKRDLAVSRSNLDDCRKAKSQPMLVPRPFGPAPNTQPIDTRDLEEFKKRILESQRLTPSNSVLSSG